VHVFNGRVYVYPSHDFSPSNTDWIMKDWKVYSTIDLNNFVDHGVIVDDNDILWKGSWPARCWAPDANEYKGKYYFYFPIGWTSAIGVVRSDSPFGPYSLPLDTPILADGCIDPSCFVDTDSSAYLLASNPGGFVIARLNEDMMSLAERPRSLIINDGIKEGPFIFKRNNLYYLSYSRCGSNCLDVIAYGTSTSVYGPYTYKGVIVSHGKIGNEHGSVFMYNDQWYAAYHNFAVHDMYRQTCFEYIHFKSNGDIVQAYPTTLGVGKYYGYTRIEAENYFAKSGGSAYAEGGSGFVMTGLSDNAWIKFPMVQFGTGQSLCSLRVAGASGGTIEIREDSATGTLLAEMSVAATGGADQFTSQALSINPMSGLKNIVMVFKNQSGNAMKLDWFTFTGGTTKSGTPLCEQRQSTAVLRVRTASAGIRCDITLSGGFNRSVTGQPLVLSLTGINGRLLWRSGSLSPLSGEIGKITVSIPANIARQAGYLTLTCNGISISRSFFAGR
jgi:arabinoxylan arabinofuranohydrolase